MTVVDENVRKGVVKWFAENHGYGFVIDEEDEEEAFVHYGTIPGKRLGKKNLEQGDEVTYIRSKNGSGLKVVQIISFTRRLQ